MERKHWGQHGEGCFACRIQSIQFSPTCFPTTVGGADAIKHRAGEKTLTKDLGAFKRLRQDGLSPKATKGAAEVERVAQSEYEVVSGQLAPKMAKGRDKDQGGKEWRRRAEDAYQSSKRGQVLEMS